MEFAVCVVGADGVISPGAVVCRIGFALLLLMVMTTLVCASLFSSRYIFSPNFRHEVR